MTELVSNEKDIWKGNAIGRFFLWCSGARIYLLRHCPTEINVYMGIGIIVFLTGILAAISGSYAIYTVFESVPTAVATGIFWGVIIFFLDWYLVASLRKDKTWWKEIVMALPRVILSIFIAYVVATPIKMRLFKQEIESRMALTQLEKRQQAETILSSEFSEIERLKIQNDSIQKQIERARQRRDHLFKLFIAEAEGTGGTGVAGKGSVYREKKAEYDRAQQELDELKNRLYPTFEQNQVRIQYLQSERDRVLTSNQMIITRTKGFLSQYHNLTLLREEDSAVDGISLFITLLFIIIETSPIIVKLLTNRGPYDDLLALEQLRTSAEAKKSYTSIRNQLLRELDLEHEMIQAEMSIHQESSRDAIAKLAAAQREINEARIQKWKEYQMGLNGKTTNGEMPVLIDFVRKFIEEKENSPKIANQKSQEEFSETT